MIACTNTPLRGTEGRLRRPEPIFLRKNTGDSQGWGINAASPLLWEGVWHGPIRPT